MYTIPLKEVDRAGAPPHLNIVLPTPNSKNLKSADLTATRLMISAAQVQDRTPTIFFYGYESVPVLYLTL